jgi:hypothetical protein
LTLDFHPGEAMQVDWADFVFALPGVPRRVSAFVAVLCYSRLLYLEFTVSQAMGSFLRCMDRALAFFGGVTTVDIFDNMKTVVLEHPRSGPVRFNPRFLAYANARGGFAVVACTPATPTAKGRVERPISFVRDRFWTGRRFQHLTDLNFQASAWRDDFANRREHAETGKVPALAFEHEEKPRLKPLSATPFETDDIEPVTVTKLYRVGFDRNRYSVPWRLSGQSLVVRADDHTVGVFVGPKQVAVHQRSWGTGGDFEHPSHRKKIGDVRSSDPADLARARFGDDGERYCVFRRDPFSVPAAFDQRSESIRSGFRSIRSEIPLIRSGFPLIRSSSAERLKHETGMVAAHEATVHAQDSRSSSSSSRVRLPVPPDCGRLPSVAVDGLRVPGARRARGTHLGAGQAAQRRRGRGQALHARRP